MLKNRLNWGPLLLLLLVVLTSGCATGKSMGSWWSQSSPQFTGDTFETALSDAKTSKDPLKRQEALLKIQQMAGNIPEDRIESTAAYLASLLPGEENPFMRVAIIETLRLFPSETTLKVLEAGQSDRAKEVRIACAEAWETMDPTRAIKALQAILQSEDDVDVILAAIDSLGKIGGVDAQQILAQYLEDRDPALQLRAMESLSQATGRDLGNDVREWQEYLKTGETPPSAAPSFAERVRGWIY
ncbi:Hypothetical protein PBC10988_14250 [Planctomycetales bacterium 10988]|nr:Hypothetical protein PBC10988_14250 [Planctomycetales bacterium 10988]